MSPGPFVACGLCQSNNMAKTRDKRVEKQHAPLRCNTLIGVLNASTSASTSPTPGPRWLSASGAANETVSRLGEAQAKKKGQKNGAGADLFHGVPCMTEKAIIRGFYA